MSQKKLSLRETIFINTNIMLGTGTFVNTAVLAKMVGALGGLLYLCTGCLIFPLSFCFARLSQIKPQGSFYSFGESLGDYWGFISTWSYFFGKLASSSLSLHVFVMFLQNSIPTLKTLPTLGLDFVLIGVFTCLNLLDVKTGSKIQYLFLSSKLLPILFVIFASLHHLNIINIQAPHLIWQGMPLALPLTLFCFLGFEAICSLSYIIDKPEKNVPRAIIISFFLVLSIIILYQTLFYLSMGESLGYITSYVSLFPFMISKAAPAFQSILNPLFSTTIGIAALGGAYGILYSNLWNLYGLGKKKLIPYANLFTKTNSHGIPYACVLAEALLCCAYLTWLKGAPVPLQYTATLGCVVTYTISVLGLVKLERSLLSILGFISCIIIGFFCIKGFVYTNLMPLIVLGTILVLGSLIYLIKYRSNEA